MSPPPTDNQPLEQSTEQSDALNDELQQWFVFFENNKIYSDIEDVVFFQFEEFISRYKAGYAHSPVEVKQAIDSINAKIASLSFRIKRDIELRASPKFFEILDDMQESLAILMATLKS